MKNLRFKHILKSRCCLGSLSGFSLLLILYLTLAGCADPGSVYTATDHEPEIFPEYSGLTLPPNIAPLNFVVKEAGEKFNVKIYGKGEERIEISGSSPRIRIPLKSWHRLLEENKGDSIFVEVYAYHDREWKKYQTITHHVSQHEIDPWLAYRLVYAVYLKWQKMGIYQRNLSNFDEQPIMENSASWTGCMNCHSFSAKDPSKMMIHFRIFNSGTLLYNNGELTKVNTKTEKTMSAGIYPSWHPDGSHIAFSVGRLNPHMTTRLNKPVDVADRVSDLILYNVDENRVSTPAALSTERRENMPVWSADGRHLYYISAPAVTPGNLEELLHSRYDLMRIPFYSQTEKWGTPQVVIDSDSSGMSVSMPSVSPNGRYLVCAMSDFGYFTIFHKQSDLYCVDLNTMEYKKLGLNSNTAESYSTWSSNSRWLVFSSKRMDEVLTRPYIAYIDETGKAHTPFVLPQKDPEMYFRLMANYNRPELIKGRVDPGPSEIRDVVMEEATAVSITR